MMAIDISISIRVKAGVGNLLRDGKWHQFGQFISIVDCVPPERATRTYLSSRSDGGGAEKPLEEQISRGRRRILRQHLNHLVKSKLIEVEGKGFDTRYRLMGFDVCDEAILVAAEIVARPSIEHLAGAELKDFLITVAQLLLIKATEVKA